MPRELKGNSRQDALSLSKQNDSFRTFPVSWFSHVLNDSHNNSEDNEADGNPFKRLALRLS